MMAPAELTALLASAERGDQSAADALFTVLYDELHHMARRELSRRGGGVTLSATTLLHEAYLDISAREGTAFPDRARVMAYACRGMRGLIIDYARRRQAQEGGGGVKTTAIGPAIAGAAAVANVDELTDLNDGLVELEQAEPRL